ncbi:MAG TPA: S1/P1 nuclease [Flavitalea sp.]|nr:S1/P1 nuclease [Flavitalea sp.]
MKSKNSYWLSAIILIFPLNVLAWGALGHRVTGGIADHYLNAKAKAELKKILGNESLALASTWADFIKSDRSYDYLGPWHYINISSGKTKEDVMKFLKLDTGTDLFTKINFLRKELKSKKLAKDKQIFYLKLLLHFVGDAHQPMHMGQPEDRGGNNIKLYWFGAPTNLHRVWDEHLVEFQQLSYTEHITAINFVSPSQQLKWQSQPISEWIYESYQAAQKLYTEVRPEDKLTYSYNYYHVNLMNMQLLKGGVRLAGLLNELFGR